MKSINNDSSRLIFNNVDGYIKVINGDEYLIFASTNKNKKYQKST